MGMSFWEKRSAITRVPSTEAHFKLQRTFRSPAVELKATSGKNRKPLFVGVLCKKMCCFKMGALSCAAEPRSFLHSKKGDLFSVWVAVRPSTRFHRV